MNFSEYIQPALTLLTGGGIATLTNFLLAKRKEDRDALSEKKKESRDDFNTVIELFREDNKRLRESEESLKNRVLVLEEQFRQVKTQLLVMETTNLDLPFPMLVKDETGIIVFLNHAYERVFLNPEGKTISDCKGRHFSEVIPTSILEQYKAKDLQAQYELVHSLESYPFKDHNLQLYVIRSPRIIAGQSVGVVTYFFDMNKMKA